MHLRAVRKDCQNVAFSSERNKTTGLQLCAGDSSTPAQMLSWGIPVVHRHAPNTQQNHYWMVYSRNVSIIALKLLSQCWQKYLPWHWTSINIERLYLWRHYIVSLLLLAFALTFFQWLVAAFPCFGKCVNSHNLANLFPELKLEIWVQTRRPTLINSSNILPAVFGEQPA